VDRDPRAGAGKRRQFRSCPGASRGKQSSITSPHHRAKHRAGSGQLPEVRLCLFALIDAELVHVGKGIERLLSAYQEALMSIEQLRERMPGLRQREQALRAELQAIADQANDRAAFLRLAENLTAFLARLRGAADTLSITERQRIVRLVVKDVLIADDTITIRHSISFPQQAPPPGDNLPPGGTHGRNYLLCKGSGHSISGQYTYRHGAEG